MLFAWFDEFTPTGLKLESDVAPYDSITHQTGKQLDRSIIAVLAMALVLLLTDRFVQYKDSTSVASVPEKSIAVLPLVNSSGDQNQQFFSDSLSEDLITALSQFAGLKVIGRNSSLQFRDSSKDSKTIGAELGVAHLLEGSVRRAGDTVRISAALVKAADGSTLWSQRFDRLYKNLFKLQDEITMAVAGALEARLLTGGAAVLHSDRPPSRNLAAYTTYLQRNFYVARNTEQDRHAAIEAYTTAVRFDPLYAAAHAALSRTWSALGAQFLGGTKQQQAYARARAAVATALTLDPDLAAAHTAHGYLLLFADFDWAGAEAAHRRAVQLTPKDGAAMFKFGKLQAALGRPEQAIELTRQALATDPLNARWYHWLGNVLTAAGQLDEAAQMVSKAIELQPGATVYHEHLAIIEVQRGNAAAALRAAQREPAGAWQQAALALALQAGTDRAAANVALQRLIDKQADVAAYQIVQVYALRKQPDQAFA